MDRPRLLLVPGLALSELDWRIKPQLEEWADVASFDAPGVGGEPERGRFDQEVLVERGLAELERLAWDRLFVVGDEIGATIALLIAAERPDAVLGIALGHPCLSLDRKRERAAVTREMGEALTQVIRTDFRTHARHLTQLTQGAYDDELAERLHGARAAGGGRALHAQPPARGPTRRRARLSLAQRPAPARRARWLSDVDEGGVPGCRCGPPRRQDDIASGQAQREPGACPHPALVLSRRPGGLKTTKIKTAQLLIARCARSAMLCRLSLGLIATVSVNAQRAFATTTRESRPTRPASAAHATSSRSAAELAACETPAKS